jgi:hypothetical protein
MRELWTAEMWMKVLRGPIEVLQSHLWFFSAVGISLTLVNNASRLSMDEKT